MWGPIWPGVPDDKRPVGYITNGVHVPTRLSSSLASVFDDFIGGDWRDRHDDPTVWARVLEIPDEELWNARKASVSICSTSSVSARIAVEGRARHRAARRGRRHRCSIRMP